MVMRHTPTDELGRPLDNVADPSPVQVAADQALARAKRRQAQGAQREYSPIMEVRQRLSDQVREEVVGLLLEQTPDDAETAASILRADPATEDDTDALDLLGCALKFKGNLSEAKEVTERSLRLKNARSLAQLAAIYFDLGQIDEAVAAARRSVESNPRIPQAWINYLHGLAKQNDAAELEKAWRQLNHDFPDWRSNPTFVDQLQRDVVMVLGPKNLTVQSIIKET